MTLQKWIDKWNGKPLEFNNDIYKNQCMDEMYSYMRDVLGVNVSPYQGRGTAINLFNTVKSDKNFTKVFNTPLNVPIAGDIIFWKKLWPITGYAGHVSIVTSANVLRFTSFDQNYPTGSKCHYQNHSYLGVVGWLRPINK